MWVKGAGNLNKKKGILAKFFIDSALIENIPAN